MPDVAIEKPITLDLLPTKTPALSATSDMPVIETKPDASNASPDKPESKPAPEVAKPEAKADEPAAPVKAKEVEAEPADDLEQPESPSASDKPKKAMGVQKRLDELTRQAREAERREQAALEREARLLALVESKEKPKAAEPDATEPVEPKREDFSDEATYTRALVKHAGEHATWSVKSELKAEQEANRKKQEQASIASETQKVQQAYVARVDKFKETHPDYSEVAESPDVSVSMPMAHAIAHSEHGPALAYHLGQNPDEAKRISQLPPVAQLMELGKLEVKLTTSPAKPVSAAPKPITPNKPASESVSSSFDPETSSMDEYAKDFQKREAAKRRPGVRH